jgi:hypothetical protein
MEIKMLKTNDNILIEHELKWFNLFLNGKGYFVCSTGNNKRILSEEFSFTPDEILLSLIKEFVDRGI